MRNPKLNISIPVFLGLSVKLREFEIPISRLSTFFRPLREFSDTKVWTTTVHSVLQYILRDMYTEGDCRGGWGKSYAERYQSHTYPQGLPSDAAAQHDTPSGTSMIVEGLTDLRGMGGLINEEIGDALDGCLNESARYFLNRYDPATGAVGVKTQLSGGDTATAYNLRHSAMALKVWRALPGQFNQIGRCCEYLINSSDVLNLSTERALTNAAVMSGLDWIAGASEDVQHYLPDTHKIPYLVKKVDIALLENWEATSRGWLDKKNREATILWYSSFVLKELSKTGSELSADLADRCTETLEMLLECLQELPGGQLAMPYRVGNSPDLGMTCMLFEIIVRSQPLRESTPTLRGLCRFINSHASLLESSEHVYVYDTYPWTLVSLFSGLNILLNQQIE
jgi:hypothetical protein